MNVYTKTKVLVKFGSFEIVSVEMRSKKQLKEIAKEPIYVKFRCTQCTCMKMISRLTGTLRMKNISFVSY